QPWPDFLTFYGSASGSGWIVPKTYVERVGDEGFKKAPIGAGPYKFVSFNPGVELVLRRSTSIGPSRRASGGWDLTRFPTRPPGSQHSSAAKSTSHTRSAASWPRSCSAHRG